MYPMLLSVGPILGSGKLIGFTGRHGSADYAFYSNNTLSYDALGSGSPRFKAPLTLADFAPAPPVAVLTGPNTLSSGEAVTVVCIRVRRRRAGCAST